MSTRSSIGTRFYMLQKTLAEVYEVDWEKERQTAMKVRRLREAPVTRMRHIVGMYPLPEENK